MAKPRYKLSIVQPRAEDLGEPTFGKSIEKDPAVTHIWQMADRVSASASTCLRPGRPITSLGRMMSRILRPVAEQAPRTGREVQQAEGPHCTSCWGLIRTGSGRARRRVDRERFAVCLPRVAEFDFRRVTPCLSALTVSRS
jgi:hypothetical protein